MNEICKIDGIKKGLKIKRVKPQRKINISLLSIKDRATKAIKIRKACANDFETILKIQKNDGFKHSYYLTRERLKLLSRREETFYLAFLDRKPAGFISVDIEIRAKLHLFSVLKDCQSMGVGSALLETVFAIAKNKKCKTLYIYVEVNSPLEEYLLRKKFKKTGVYYDRYGKGRDSDILMMHLIRN